MTAVNEAIPEDERQPTRTGRAETTRTFDQTFLDTDTDVIHRDYIAHALRWGFSKRNFIIHEKTQVLDVGCGPTRPMLLVLFGGIGASPLARRYVGVDLNKIKPTTHKRSTLYPQFNFIERVEELRKKEGTFDLITNFEVIEHMPVAMGRKLLAAMKRMMTPAGRILLSTPVYDGKARAANHIHEYTIPELESIIHDTGLVVEERYGTFANYNDIKKVASKDHLQTLNDIRTWFGNEVAACFLAPLYPNQSRNNYWVIRQGK
jgi:2-polyprenyl-3-methyl-5-hydroxy-6-metoxy-1,4-benzoquinol methylase